MTAIRNSCHITLTSNPHRKRPGVIVLSFFLAMSLAGVVVYGGYSLVYFYLNPLFNTIMLLVLGVFGTVVGLFTTNLMNDAYRDYMLELTDSEVILVVIDRMRKKRGVKMVLVEDIRYAEYYPHLDSSMVIFHTAYTDMEVPLFPLANQGRDVIDFLEGRGVRIINVLSDDPIPD